MTSPLRLAHTSDWHLGLRQFDARTTTGRNRREQDLLRAAANVTDSICDADPDLVIHAGDVFETPTPKTSHQHLFQALLRRLTRHPDGTVRPVLVISGNHDQPSDLREPAAIVLNTPIGGTHIVTDTYTRLHLADHYPDPALATIVVHAIPHDLLRTIDWDTVTPEPDMVNILTCHGVVGGSDLYKRTKGREYAIPADVLTRGWAYVAMGHWHKRGPVPVGDHTGRTTPVWYAGSPENNDFGEACGPDGQAGRGWLEVTVTGADQPPAVVGHDLPIRPMFTLPDIDGAGRTAEQVQADLCTAAANPDLSGAVVRQRLTGVTRDEWHLVDVDTVRRSAAHTMWYELVRLPDVDDPTAAPADAEPVDDIDEALHSALDELAADDPDRAAVAALTEDLLAAALAARGDDT